MGPFKAVQVTQEDSKLAARIVQLTDADLDPGDVTVAVDYSTINYKDGLAITGLGGIIKRFPMIPGIDLAGTVEASSNPSFKVGDKVVLNGYEAGVTHNGGLAQRARVKSDWLVKLPEDITTRQAAAIGTAGYAAMLCVLALERGGVRNGDILVTGAAGGVGSVAIAILAKLGYRVVASTGLEYTMAVSVVCRRAVALFTGSAVMLFLARNAEPSPARSALIMAMVVSCLMLAALGCIELVVGHVAPKILIPMSIEITFALAMLHVGRGNKKAFVRPGKP